jgi:SAM-dependent methyltransferase
MKGSGYLRDLAWIHDAGFGAFARHAAPGIVRILRRSGIRRGLVVDIGCGSGILAERLAAAGYSFLGIDISPAMVRIARGRVPGARFVADSFLEARIPDCDAVTATGECFNYLLDRRNDARRLRSFFRRIHRALRPGGIFVFDFLARSKRAPRSQSGHVVGPGWVVIFENTEDAKKGLITRRIATFRRVRGLYRRTDEIHRLRTYDRGEMGDWLRESGFSVRFRSGYATAPLAEGHIIAISRRAR